MQPLRIVTSFILSLLLLTGCDNIEADERLIYQKPEAAQRVVLLEDFTGQRCVNCPKATEMIEQLQQQYGDNIIAVGIHGGPLGFKGSATLTGLATDVGDEYYNHWKLEYQPVGLVNRHGAVNYTDWTTMVKEELVKPAPVSLQVRSYLEGNVASIYVKAKATDGNINGKMQVWLVEDSITAMQLMPDGKANAEYIHNHVLRTPVNGTWGQDFNINEGYTCEFGMTQAIDPSWNLQHLSIVAFAWNDDGVQQAIKEPLTINNKQ